MVFGPVKLSKAIISPYKLLISPFNDADNEVSLSDSHNYEHALGGNDLVHGNGGDDILFGDQGYDVLYGEDGNDNLYGGTENDWLSGGSGNNFIDGGAGTGDSVAYTWYGNTEGRVYVNLAECWAADASVMSVGCRRATTVRPSTTLSASPPMAAGSTPRLRTSTAPPTPRTISSATNATTLSWSAGRTTWSDERR